MSSPYQPEAIAEYFDDLGEGEWDRLKSTPEAEISLAVHRHYLELNIKAGWRVLEVGAGAGRFTIELARLGCTVLVADISPVQLVLNQAKVAEAGLEGAVEDRLLLDVVDMAALADSSFDAVVCYGGPLSYAMDRRGAALSECIRVLRPRGRFLASVMSLWGSVHKGLPFVMSVPPEANDTIIATGDITSEVLPGHKHYCHAFRDMEFRDFLVGAGLTIESMSASTSLTTGWGENLDKIRKDVDRWDELTRMEIEACAQPGCIGAGPHIVAVASKAE